MTSEHQQTAKPEKVQLRGHCPYCGSEQAVVQGRMAKHGYQVDAGEFHGVCPGQRYAPIELEQDTAIRFIAELRAEGERLRQRADNLESGKETLSLGRDSDASNAKLVPFDTLPRYRQEDLTERAVCDIRNHASSNEARANRLDTLRRAFHGKPLRKVKPPEAPPAIQRGERRENPHCGVTEATEIHGGRVRWTDADGRKGSVSTRTWRSWPLAAAKGAK